jgi:hypothetical protein
VSAHKKKKNKNKTKRNTEMIPKNKKGKNTHTHKRTSAFPGRSHTHTSVATNNIPAGKFDKSPTFPVPPRLRSITKHTRERERERKKKDTKESGKAWTSLLALLMEGWCVWMKDKRKRVHPSIHPVCSNPAKCLSKSPFGSQSPAFSLAHTDSTDSVS